MCISGSGYISKFGGGTIAQDPIHITTHLRRSPTIVLITNNDALGPHRQGVHLETHARIPRISDHHAVLVVL